jgi:CubicO group peptidase (beta-lactamase class C family)
VSAKKIRKETWITLIVLAAGIPIAGLAGVLMYMNVTAARLHPNPQEVTSVMHATPSARWAGAAEDARQRVRAGISSQNAPGLSVAVAMNQELIWAEGFGWANVESRTPVTPDTRFRIGHTSKALTAAAVGLLLERRRLRLEDEIQVSVPAFPKKQWPITLRQLMGHLAGVRHYLGEEADVPAGHCDRASDGLATFANDPLLFEPQSEARYSTYGWILVSAAVEAAANEPFFTFMRTQVFAPLGMNDTMPDSGPVSATIPNLARFYFPRFSGDNEFGQVVARAIDYSCFMGAGAFLSTPSDLVRFGIAMGSGALLQPDTVRVLQTTQQLASGKDTEYGLGWTVESFPLAGQPTQLVSHASRSLVGGSTSFMIFPERGIVVAVTSNTSYANLRAIALDVAAAFAEPAKRPAGR